MTGEDFMGSRSLSLLANPPPADSPALWAVGSGYVVGNAYWGLFRREGVGEHLVEEKT